MSAETGGPSEAELSTTSRGSGIEGTDAEHTDVPNIILEEEKNEPAGLGQRIKEGVNGKIQKYKSLLSAIRSGKPVASQDLPILDQMEKDLSKLESGESSQANNSESKEGPSSWQAAIDQERGRLQGVLGIEPGSDNKGSAQEEADHWGQEIKDRRLSGVDSSEPEKSFAAAQSKITETQQSLARLDTWQKYFENVPRLERNKAEAQEAVNSLRDEIKGRSLAGSDAPKLREELARSEEDLIRAQQEIDELTPVDLKTALNGEPVQQKEEQSSDPQESKTSLESNKADINKSIAEIQQEIKSRNLAGDDAPKLHEELVRYEGALQNVEQKLTDIARREDESHRREKFGWRKVDSDKSQAQNTSEPQRSTELSNETIQSLIKFAKGEKIDVQTTEAPKASESEPKSVDTLLGDAESAIDNGDVSEAIDILMRVGKDGFTTEQSQKIKEIMGNNLDTVDAQTLRKGLKPAVAAAIEKTKTYKDLLEDETKKTSLLKATTLRYLATSAEDVDIKNNLEKYIELFTGMDNLFKASGINPGRIPNHEYNRDIIDQARLKSEREKSNVTDEQIQKGVTSEPVQNDVNNV